MTKRLISRNIFFGFLSWLIPFAVSFLFYRPGGELIIPYATFKTSIVVVGTISGCYLLFRYFKLIDVAYIWNGYMVGFSWLAINLILDSIFLLPMMKTTFSEYFMTIGLGYLAIPTISIAMGFSLDRKIKN